MLLTVCYAYLTFTAASRVARRKMKILNLVRQYALASGLSFKSGKPEYLCHLTQEISASVFWEETSASKKYTEVVLWREDDNRMTIIQPKPKVDLDEWTSFIGSARPLTPTTRVRSGQVLLLLEATLPAREDDGKGEELPLSQSVPLTRLSEPLAWRSGDPYGLLVSTDVEGLGELGLAFMDSRLKLDDGMEAVQMISVDTSGNSQDLLSLYSRKLKSPGQNNSGDNNKELGGLRLDLPNRQQLREESTEVEGQLSCGDTPKVRSVQNSGQVDDGSLQDTMSAEFDERDSPEMLTKLQAKPPNILVYTGSKDSQTERNKFEQVREFLQQCLGPDHYIIYRLKHDQVLSHPWAENTILLVAATQEQFEDSVNQKFEKFVEDGGRLLSFCSHFNMGLDVQPLPFLSGEVGVHSMVYRPLEGAATELKVYVTGRCYTPRLKAHQGSTAFKVIGTMKSGNQPVILHAYAGYKGGRAILSQVHLEMSPTEDDVKGTEMFTQLKKSNPQRYQVLQDLLTTLGMTCSQGTQTALTPAQLLVTEDALQDTVVQAISSHLDENNALRGGKVSLLFVDGDTEANAATPEELPVLVGGAAESFNWQVYQENLQTGTLGKVVLYTEVIPTTMTVLDRLSSCVPEDTGLIAIAHRQTSGQGRGGNVWLSPLGCAMFTLHVRIPLQSELGHRLPFIQHIMSLAVVDSVRTLPGYQDIDLRLKWPNDIYYGDSMKLGGVIVNSSIVGNNCSAFIGCGFNVSNSNPTICINDLVKQHNKLHNTSLPEFTTEELIAHAVTITEEIIQEFQENGSDSFLQRYYSRWLHSEQKVHLSSEEGPEATILGLDDSGFLSVVKNGGEIVSVQPDGNTFDMLRNLITIKS
ncbi:PREDICTED: biotin--protein ligase-like [Branchiostoma belcheri]|uniref:Biotin--protein ligase-like n=1 Tax=Branchiostoma belcheri TaxID=7741 RepID=A0A6P4Y3U2_BRABE|nr:PREDICTED: biotin--protein ligase-like [Branchiostoma belcheri]